MARVYSELSSCRGPGMMTMRAVDGVPHLHQALGTIPTPAIEAWADRRGLDPEIADHLVLVLRLVDAAMVKRSIKP